MQKCMEECQNDLVDLLKKISGCILEQFQTISLNIISGRLAGAISGEINRIFRRKIWRSRWINFCEYSLEILFTSLGKNSFRNLYISEKFWKKSAKSCLRDILEENFRWFFEKTHRGNPGGIPEVIIERNHSRIYLKSPVKFEETFHWKFLMKSLEKISQKSH